MNTIKKIAPRFATLSAQIALFMFVAVAAQAQKSVRVTNTTPSVAYVQVSGWGYAYIQPYATVGAGPKSDLRRSCYVRARVGYYTTSAIVPYQGDMLSCRIVQTNTGTIRIVW